MDLCIDQQDDHSNKELYQVLSGYDIPEYVKEAELSSVRPELEKEAFADSMARKFPINSKANIFISNAFLLNKSAALEKVKPKGYVTKIRNKIEKAAKVLEIEDDLKYYANALKEKQAADFTDYSISVKLQDDESVLFPIKVASQVTSGAATFVREINNYPFEWRRDIARAFVKAAEALNVDELPDVLMKYAGYFYPDPSNLKAELLRRATKVPEGAKETYEKLAEAAEDICSKEEIFKMAEICYSIEREANLYKTAQSRKILGDPVDRLFTLSPVKVAELLDTVTMAGEKFAMEDLRKIPSDVYTQAFGFDIDPKTAEAKDILPTMPRTDVELFKQLSGVKPI